MIGQFLGRPGFIGGVSGEKLQFLPRVDVLEMLPHTHRLSRVIARSRCYQQSHLGSKEI